MRYVHTAAVRKKKPSKCRDKQGWPVRSDGGETLIPITTIIPRQSTLQQPWIKVVPLSLRPGCRTPRRQHREGIHSSQQTIPQTRQLYLIKDHCLSLALLQIKRFRISTNLLLNWFNFSFELFFKNIKQLPPTRFFFFFLVVTSRPKCLHKSLATKLTSPQKTDLYESEGAICVWGTLWASLTGWIAKECMKHLPHT